MAYLMVSEAPSRAEYDAVAGLVELRADRPRGLLLHAAAETADGTVRVVDLWESLEDAQVFGDRRIRPAFAGAGVDRDRPHPPLHPTFELLR